MNYLSSGAKRLQRMNQAVGSWQMQGALKQQLHISLTPRFSGVEAEIATFLTLLRVFRATHLQGDQQFQSHPQPFSP